jgi:hypothetical protein
MGTNLDTLKALDALAAFVETLPLIGAEVYANGARRATPIVDRHFTAGNQQRYGWAPLSRAYFLRKQQGLKGKVRKGVFFPGKGKKGSKLDKGAEFQSSTGALTGIGSGTNKPMLVNSGLTRQAVSGGSHTISLSGDVALVTFRGLPDYAEYLHTGTGKMPKRSPVEPGPDDITQVGDEMEKALSAQTARLGFSPVSSASIPAQARIV